MKLQISEIADIISNRVDNPSDHPELCYVGLEHYVSGDVTIDKFQDTSMLKSSAKAFQSGDILVARRNVYLKRAGIVNFDGITSGDSIVLRPKTDAYRNILPFALNTDSFWEYAEKYADGTMSKRLSPEILSKYEINLPEGEDNIISISNVLWSMYNLIQVYKKMIIKTDEMVKSQFIGVFIRSENIVGGVFYAKV